MDCACFKHVPDLAPLILRLATGVVFFAHGYQKMGDLTGFGGMLDSLGVPLPGFFAVLGKFRGVEVDSLFITALLTILGFSIHDTIVVFDRIREYLQKYPYKSVQTIIDYSVVSTMARSINTSSTLIFVLVAMFLFGGATISNFVLTLLVGVIVGTYSSIFIASPLIYLWWKRKSTA